MLISSLVDTMSLLIVTYYTAEMVYNFFSSDYELLFGGYSQNSQIQVTKEVDVRFQDVVGLKEVKKDLKQYINYMNHREQYQDAGFQIPKGVIFAGPPGTGKTMLSKAMAGETNATFIYVCGSDFVEVFVGVGAQRVRKLFKKARESTPCIIFFDEIDSIGSSRNSHHGHSEHNSTLNQLLEEMDGFKNNEGIMVIAATNMYETLDPALKRSGRFDRKIVFDRPNVHEREKMFHLYLGKTKLAPQFQEQKTAHLEKLAKLTSGATGADIANIANQAAGHYVNRKYPVEVDEYEITPEVPEGEETPTQESMAEPVIENGAPEDGIILEDLIRSIDEVTVGMEKRERLLSEKEKQIVAYHEAGHSLVAYLMKDTRPPIKISIIPRGEAALGYSLQEPMDQKLHQYEELLATLCVLIGGRLGEKIKFNRISTGAYDDLQKMTRIAYQIVTVYGMSQKLGPMNLSQQHSSQKESMLEDLSDHRKNEIDNEVEKMVSYITKYTEDLLRDHTDHLEILAQHLLQHEEMTTDEIDTLLGETGIQDSVEVPTRYM